VHNDLTWDILV